MLLPWYWKLPLFIVVFCLLFYLLFDYSSFMIISLKSLFLLGALFLSAYCPSLKPYLVIDSLKIDLHHLCQRTEGLCLSHSLISMCYPHLCMLLSASLCPHVLSRFAVYISASRVSCAHVSLSHILPLFRSFSVFKNRKLRRSSTKDLVSRASPFL